LTMYVVDLTPIGWTTWTASGHIIRLSFAGIHATIQIEISLNLRAAELWPAR
jgi:hypothetical protein